MRSIAILLSILLLVLTGCSDYDNYDEADSFMSGGIYDLATKGGVEKLIPAQAPNGAEIYYYEGNVTQRLAFSCKTDGTFYNSKVFSGEYRIIPVGPFITTPEDTIRTYIPAGKDLNFYVEPYLRIKNVSGKVLSDKIEATFTISKSEKWRQQLIRYSLYYSWTEHIDDVTYMSKIDVQVSAGDEANVLDKEITLSIPEIDLDGKTQFDRTKPMYIRISARTAGTNYSNYSEIIKIQ